MACALLFMRLAGWFAEGMYVCMYLGGYCKRASERAVFSNIFAGFVSFFRQMGAGPEVCS
jgi:hypothetical protein